MTASDKIKLIYYFIGLCCYVRFYRNHNKITDKEFDEERRDFLFETGVNLDRKAVSILGLIIILIWPFIVGAAIIQKMNGDEGKC